MKTGQVDGENARTNMPASQAYMNNGFRGIYCIPNTVNIFNNLH